MKLNELATVRSGLVIARKLVKKPDSEHAISYRTLNLRSIQADGSIALDEVDLLYAAEPLGSIYLTKSGDIIVRLSIPYTAVLIDETTAGLVVSSNFVIIRCKTNLLLPDYLVWLLNTSEVKRDISGSTGGNMLGAVKPSYFCSMEVTLLSMANQEIIADLNALSLREQRLLRHLAAEKERYYVYMIEQIQKDMRRSNK